MNEHQKRTIIDFTLGRCRKEALAIALGFDVDTDPHAIFRLLDEAMRSGDGTAIECALMIAGGRTKDIDMVPTLIDLLRSTAHKHEDVTRWLQNLRDPRAIDALYVTAVTKYAYLEHDDGHALARKCTWALADIGTVEAQEKLRLLAANVDPEIAGYAQKRLDNWTMETARKGLPQKTGA